MAVGGQRLIDTDGAALPRLPDAWSNELEGSLRAAKSLAAAAAAHPWTVAGAVLIRPRLPSLDLCWVAGRLPTA